ncbi:MAG: NPCBM/NEW2 domain-containing protein [Planctomycetota bacterium]
MITLRILTKILTKLAILTFMTAAASTPVSAQAGGVEVQFIRGERIAGDVQSLSAESLQIGVSGSGVRTIATKELISIQFRRPETTGANIHVKNEKLDPNHARVEFEGGDILSGTVSGGGAEKLQLTLAGTAVAAPIDSIRKIIFTDRVPKGTVDFAPGAEGDRLYRIHRPAGSAEVVVEAVNGTLVSFSEKNLEFEGVLGKTPFPYEELAAIVLAPLGGKSNVAKFEPACAITTIPDGRIRAVVESMTPTLLKINAGPLGKLQIPARAISSIRFKSAEYVDLSDLDPAEVTETPYFGGEPALRFPWKRNRNVTGGAIVVGGILYESGIGVHSKSVMHYSLDGTYSIFRTKAGIDDATLTLPRKGSVIFKISCDGKKVWESGIVRTGDRAVSSPDVQLKGVKKLTLEVDYSDGFDIADRANWCDPILLK